MPPRRPVTPAQKEALDEGARLYVAETEAKLAAKAEAQQLILTRTQHARKATNDMLWRLCNELNINRTQVAMLCLGTSDRQQLYRRLREVDDERDGVVAPVIVQKEYVAPEVSVMTVEPHDDGVSVHMTDYSHPDLGQNLTGSLVFNAEGEVTDSDGDLTEAVNSSQLWALTLWGMPAVQEHA